MLRTARMPALALCCAVLVALVALTLAACQRGPRAQPTPPRPDRAWSEIVAGHTAGVVSRHAHVTIRFARDVIAPEQVGQDARAALETEPAIAGEARYAGVREIVLRPAEPLAAGQHYRVRLRPQALRDVPEKLAPYEFDFSVIARNFEVKAAALESVAGQPQSMVLRGTLETADGETPAVVEQMLRAQLDGKAQALEWAHFNDNRTHYFTLAGVQRRSEAGRITLAWTGAPLGVEGDGARDIEVPPLGRFSALGAQVLRDGQQSIQVSFSDPLDERQNLDGLVTLGRQRLTTRIQGNALLVYPADPMTGAHTLSVSAGLRSAQGAQLGADFEAPITFVNERPQVRFVGSGVVLPDNAQLTIPIEAMNVHSLQVTAFQVYADDVGQFLQTNALDGAEELHRVGRYLWRKTIRLPAPQSDRWTRYALDASELLRAHPGALFRLSLSVNRGNSTYRCSAEDSAVPVVPEEPFRNHEDLWLTETSGWDGIEDWYDEEGRALDWRERENPCKDAYYRWNEGTKAARNFLASNLGLLAKRGADNRLQVVATALSDARPLAGVRLDVRNFQNQTIAQASTDAQGFAAIELPGAPFYLVARKDAQIGYLKLARGVALPTSHFDTGGETVSGGIKGFIYGERGVWRPGDTLHLTFVLEDKADRIPDGHPVTLQLFDPKGQLQRSLTNAEPVDDFYAFAVTTPEDAPTGNWRVKVLVGGAEFSKRVKIETVMPNRLKLALAFARERLEAGAMPVPATLSAQWLHGAKAAGLKADVAVQLAPVATRFTRMADFGFDDPVRRFSGERQEMFSGHLDADGAVTFNLNLAPEVHAAGALEANFTTRVFEPGGAFSTSQTSVPFHRYDRYVGLKLPKGDATRNMLVTDTPHTVELATLDAGGTPQAAARVEVAVYKISWKWWWEKTPEDLAQFEHASHHSAIEQASVSTGADGRGQWQFRIKYPDWGRYLVRACLPDGGHCAGQIVFVDWPGWAGRPQEQAGPGASALAFSSDKPRYVVGETAQLTLPEASEGRALLSIESGTRIVSQRWVEIVPGRTRLELPITREMTPNVYVSLTLLQPHAGKSNDRPIRLYGIVPIEVSDPETVLAPQIASDALWRPEGRVSLAVSEKNGRAMTYTVAVVDEGLLGLTGFRTPDPHAQFYKREALGVATWDLFDHVAGAYGGELERLLALGGDEGAGGKERNPEQRRFPPVVRVLGPFRLERGQTAEHAVELPQYVGELRVMVVAGHRGAYGAAEKSVVVRQPLSILPTLPRVLGPGETVQLPVSVFAFEPQVREARVRIETDASFEVEGPDSASVRFDAPGERLVGFGLKLRDEIRTGRVTLRAEGAGERTQATLHVPVRPQNPVVLRSERRTLEPGEEWTLETTPFGVAGTSRATLEVSSIPPFDLERRLQYLVRYPHGCVEQLTSAAFPQLFLERLMRLDPARSAEIERNVHAAIDRLQGYQMSSGGFAYWPGDDDVNAWANNYAGHFLAAARTRGFHVPEAILNPWIEFQKEQATRWTGGSREAQMTQAYRLYTLALADRPELGAMNRLRESGGLDAVARWQLAAAYARVGLADAARELLRDARDAEARYPTPGETFGSALRDRAILVDALLLANERERAEPLIAKLAQELASDLWHSTQSTAYGLMALARAAGGEGSPMRFSYASGTAAPQTLESKSPLHSERLPGLARVGGRLFVKNTSDRRLYASLLREGSPPPGGEAAQAEGLALDLRYTASDGAPLDVARLAQGTDFQAHVTVTNRTGLEYRDLALTQVFASGWEIHNPRFEPEGQALPQADYQDVRDDRVMTYFGLKPGESRTFRVLLNAAYRGRYYLPATSVESMYDAARHADTAGRWVEVQAR